MINLFIQARMTSSRFPGKMLAPLHGKPLISHVVETLQSVAGINQCVVLTSTEPSDDPLVLYLKSQNCAVFRGDLNHVFLRFQNALNAYPCDAFARICADSPMIDSDLVSEMIALFKAKNCDFLSNVHHKKFPKGQSVEIIKSKIFTAIDADTLDAEQREHVIPYFYKHADQYDTYFVDSETNARHINTCVDTVEDLKNIELGKIQYKFDKGTLC